MKINKHLLLTLALLCCASMKLCAQRVLVSGVPWYDDRDSIVSAHGGNIVFEDGTYYLFGEYKTDSANVFNGFSCYSSTDLVNWKFESIALPVQKAGRLGPHTVGERPKVLHCPYNGEYVMYMHTDNLAYKDPQICYATSKSITGPYTLKGAIMLNGQPMKRWDLGAFVDDDGKAYLLCHGGEIYRLSMDYHSIISTVCKGLEGFGEAPAMFHKDGKYYFLGSQKTSWERNDNVYYTANSIFGPWTLKGTFAPKGTLTWNSQSNFVLPYESNGKKIYMYMGDRWSFPKQHSAATYVWQPINTEEGEMSLPRLKQFWDPYYGSAETIKKLGSGTATPNTIVLNTPGETFDASVKIKEGGRIALEGSTSRAGGYARVSLQQVDGWKEIEATIDMYSKHNATGLVYLSPKLPKGVYHVKVTVDNMKSNWTDKTKTIYGTLGTRVDISNIWAIDQ